jgi:hypothetical protein
MSRLLFYYPKTNLFSNKIAEMCKIFDARCGLELAFHEGNILCDHISLTVQAAVIVVLLIGYSLVFCDQMLCAWPVVTHQQLMTHA